MSLTVLSVAYPFAPIGAQAVGGAEQILSCLDCALVQNGHRSIVIACAGSRSIGELIALPRPGGLLDEAIMAEMRARCRRAIEAVLRQQRVDVVHMHGVDFHFYLPPAGVPVLATLHLPVRQYPPEALNPSRPDTWFHCVSPTQQNTCPMHPRLLPAIENGVFCDDGGTLHAKRRFALMLSRICPEKGVHLAVDAAKRADIPLLVAGEVFPYRDHQLYFAQQVEPRLDRWRRFIGPVDTGRRRRLLAAARCVLIPSLIPETSSLAAREAIAAGTPAIAFGAGALAETIEHGRTGFLVRDLDEMASAIEAAPSIDPQVCRRIARERFSLDRMIQAYFRTYDALARGTSHLKMGAVA